MAELINREYALVSADTLEVHPENARRGDLTILRESIRANGFYGVCVVQKSTNYILAGNHRFLAAVEEGITEIPTVYVDVDDDEARRLLLIDNRTTDLATYDDSKLKELLEIVKATERGLIGSGYDDTDYGDLLFQIDTVTPGYGTLRTNDSMVSVSERANDYYENAISTIVLPFPTEVADSLHDMLDALRADKGYESNAAIVQELIEKAYEDLNG